MLINRKVTLSNALKSIDMQILTKLKFLQSESCMIRMPVINQSCVLHYGRSASILCVKAHMANDVEWDEIFDYLGG